MASRDRTRRHRRNERRRLKHGYEAAPKHKLVSGRTGVAHSKKVTPKCDGMGVVSRVERGRTSIKWAEVHRKVNKTEEQE